MCQRETDSGEERASEKRGKHGLKQNASGEIGARWHSQHKTLSIIFGVAPNKGKVTGSRPSGDLMLSLNQSL